MKSALVIAAWSLTLGVSLSAQETRPEGSSGELKIDVRSDSRVEYTPHQDTRPTVTVGAEPPQIRLESDVGALRVFSYDAERRYSLDRVLPPAAATPPASRPTRLALPEPRMSRDDEVGPVERYLAERLRQMTGLVSYRFEDTTIRTYGAADAENPRRTHDASTQIVRWNERGPSGVRKRELVTLGASGLHASITHLLTRMETCPADPIRFHVRLVANPAVGSPGVSARVLSLDDAAVRRRFVVPPAPGGRVLVEGTFEAAPLRPARVDALRTRAFTVDSDVPSGEDAKRLPPSPIVDYVPEGARVSVAPILVSEDRRDVEVMLGFDLAQILRPVRTLKTTSEHGVSFQCELPDTNETTWRSNILPLSPGRTGIAVDGIRWLSVDPEGMFDLALFVAADGPPATSGEAATARERLPVRLGKVVALGKDGTALVAVEPYRTAVRPGMTVATFTGESTFELQTIEGSLLLIKHRSGPPAAYDDVIVLP